MVVTWHFTHGSNGYPVAFDYVPALIPLSLLDEGHTGVALFMTLSGYLFAKLLDGKSIDYPAFLWNRALRLLPLLSVVILIVGIRKLMAGESLTAYGYQIARGLYSPGLPNGGWSITIEFHFYLLLPIFLMMMKRSKLRPTCFVIAAIALRTFLYGKTGDIQLLSYATLIGRIDQFAMGMVIFQFRRRFIHNTIAFTAVIVLMSVYWYFDSHGGFYRASLHTYAGHAWVWLPTVEGIIYAIIIAWYDNADLHLTGRISNAIGKMGEYSYSIYLLHIFIVYDAAGFIHTHIMGISNFYLACGWSAVFFMLMIIPGYLSFRLIESPFLKFRKPYIMNITNQQAATDANLTQSTVMASHLH
jgi:peptidoglycan/LPS O-acetylase OafA/YrhL